MSIVVTKKLLIASALLSLMAACSTTQIAEYDADSRYDVSTFQTFAVMPISPQTQIGRRPLTPTFMRDLQESVVNRLRTLGYQPAPVDEADIVLAIQVQNSNRLELGTPYFHSYGYFHRRYFAYPHYWDSYSESSLILDIIESRSRNIVWRGWRTYDHRGNPSDGYIQAALNAILEVIPPHSNTRSS